MSARDTRRSKLDELKALRQTKKTRLSTYKTQEEEKIYEELDDEGLRRHQRARLDEDDFVVDDNGEGYVDNGLGDWDSRYDHSDSFESDEEGKSRVTNGIHIK